LFPHRYSAADVYSVSCGAAGDCTAGGYYTDGSGAGTDDSQAFVVSETNGVWRNAIEVPGTAALNLHGGGQVNSVSCVAAGACAAVGYYADAAHALQAFVVSSPPLLRLRAGSTTCNGLYSGSGGSIDVPAGDTCTLAPGTHVSRNVTVDGGGRLVARGVTIDGALTVTGGATVCDSRIAGAVTAVSARGSLRLGGGTCEHGNTFATDVLVENDTHDVSIEGNDVAGNLAVLNSHGETTAIVRNSVRNLRVANSGPVVITNNRATGTMRCTANDPQHGSGNKAQGTNTCPR
jgi:hypothetical protein